MNNEEAMGEIINDLFFQQVEPSVIAPIIAKYIVNYMLKPLKKDPEETRKLLPPEDLAFIARAEHFKYITHRQGRNIVQKILTT
jgi:hypothetical protein